MSTITPPQETGFAIRSVRNLAVLLRIHKDALKQLASQAESLYRQRDKHDEKRKKTIRIEEPLGRLKEVQSRIQHLLRPVLSSSPISFGAIKTRDSFQAASLHTAKAVVVTIDIHDFYGHVTLAHVHDAFLGLGCSPRVARLLAQLTTRCNRLPKGAPSSPAIANLVMLRFDRAKHGQAAMSHVVLSRYMDDIAISGDSEEAVFAFLAMCFGDLHGLKLPVHRERREVDGKKPKFNIQLYGNRQEVVGLNVAGVTPTVPGKYRRHLRDTIRQKQRFGATSKEIQSLRGRIAYVRRSHPKQAAILEQQLMLFEKGMLRNESGNTPSDPQGFVDF